MLGTAAVITRFPQQDLTDRGAVLTTEHKYSVLARATLILHFREQTLTYPGREKYVTRVTRSPRRAGTTLLLTTLSTDDAAENDRDRERR